MSGHETQAMMGDTPVVTGTVINESDDGQPFTKGEKQPPRCRDPVFAILYYIHLCCILGVAFVIGIPSLKKNAWAKGDATVDSVEVSGIVVTAVISALFAFVGSAFSLGLMMKYAKTFIKTALLVSVASMFLFMIINFAVGNVVGGILCLVFFLLTACYAYCVWSRIPFAAANLNTGLSAVRCNMGLVCVAYGMTLWAIVYSLMWSLALTGTYTQSITCDNEGKCVGTINGFVMFLLLLAFYWAEETISNTIHVTVAGTVGTWWYAPQEANSCCSQAVKESFYRASTYSFGSICFGSLLVAIIQAIRAMVENARNNEDANPLLLCIVECLLACIQSLIEYFNKWAFIYVGLYGYSYMEAGKNVMSLFEAKGFSTVITDDLVGGALNLVSLVIGLLSGLIGMIPAASNKELFAGVPDGSEKVIGFFVGFIVGLVISSIMMSVVASSVNTVIVCFAEGPAEFQTNHPVLCHEMKEAWQSAYPELANW